jgi:hypothetical protein
MARRMNFGSSCSCLEEVLLRVLERLRLVCLELLRLDLGEEEQREDVVGVLLEETLELVLRLLLLGTRAEVVERVGVLVRVDRILGVERPVLDQLVVVLLGLLPVSDRERLDEARRRGVLGARLLAVALGLLAFVLARGLRTVRRLRLRGLVLARREPLSDRDRAAAYESREEREREPAVRLLHGALLLSASTGCTCTSRPRSSPRDR